MAYMSILLNDGRKVKKMCIRDSTSPTDSQGSAKGGINIEGKIKVNENARKETDENDKPSEVVKKVKTCLLYTSLWNGSRGRGVL